MALRHGEEGDLTHDEPAREVAALRLETAERTNGAGTTTKAQDQPTVSFRQIIGRVLRWIEDGLAEEARFGHGFLWLPVFMAAGAAIDLSAPRDIALSALVIPLMMCVALAALSRIKGWRAGWVAVASAAFLAGLTAAALQVRTTHTILLDGPVVTHLTGTVLAREDRGRSGWRYLVDVETTAHPAIRRPPRRVRLVARGHATPIGVGHRLTGLARLLPPSGPVLPGGYDFAYNSFFSGIGAVGFFYGPPHEIEGAGPAYPPLSRRLEDAVAQTRATIADRIRSVLPGQDGALATALIVANRGAIPEATVSALRDAGLAHILAISGLHMALVAGTVFFVLRLFLGLSRFAAEALPAKKIAAVAALMVATVYLILSGAAVSTQRAWIMLAIVLVAILLDRSAVTLRNVAIAAAVIIVADPAAVVGPSFQMSFAATVALIAGYSAWKRRAAGDRAAGHEPRLHVAVLKIVGTIAFTSLIAGSATAIFAAFHFYKMATMGVLGNLLAMPVISFLVMPMGLLSVLAMPYGLEWLPLKAMGFGLHIVIAIAYEVQALGGSARTGQIPGTVLIVFIAGFTILVLMRSRLRLTGAFVIAIALLLDITLLSPRRPDVLVSEDGTLVGLPTDGAIATNRVRPPAFVFDQWLDALGERTSLPPSEIHVGRPSPARHRKGAPHQPPDPLSIDALRKVLADPAGRMTCNGRAWCAVNLHGAVSIAQVDDLAYLGPACDLADIVIAPAPIRLDHCRSGAMLLTGRTLRRSGALAIRLEKAEKPPSRGEPPPDAPSSSRDTTHAKTRPAGSSKSPASTRLTITSALGGVLRPWTVQRYYDWRRNRFDLANAIPHIERIVVRAPNDIAGSTRPAAPGS